MNTVRHIHNRVTLRKGNSTTLYEIWKGRKPIVKYFHVFGSKCYILADHEQRRKMDPKSDEGIFLGYSTNSRAYRVFNSITKVMAKSINVVVDDRGLQKEVDVQEDVETYLNDTPAEITDRDTDLNPIGAEPEPSQKNKGPSIRIQKDHPKELIIGDLNKGVTTRSRESISNSCFVSKFEAKNIKEALTDEFWIKAMQEEL